MRVFDEVRAARRNERKIPHERIQDVPGSVRPVVDQHIDRFRRVSDAEKHLGGIDVAYDYRNARIVKSQVSGQRVYVEPII